MSQKNCEGTMLANFDQEYPFIIHQTQRDTQILTQTHQNIKNHENKLPIWHFSENPAVLRHKEKDTHGHRYTQRD